MTDDPEDVNFTLEEQAIIDGLSSDELSRIDDTILAAIKTSFRKVAYVVSVVRYTFPDVPDIYLAQRVENLVERGFLESQGNLKKMGFREVRLPSPPLSEQELQNLISQKSYFTLGCIYGDGQGVAKDYAESFKWHLLGASQGNVWSQLNIGRAYEDGRGVAQDNLEAYFWYFIAARLSEADSFPFADRRDEQVKKLSKEEIEIVQERAQTWTPV